MGSAAQTFPFARLRRARSITPVESRPDEQSSSTSKEESLNGLTPLQDASASVQPVIVAGLATSDAPTVTIVAGASVGPLTLTEHPKPAPAPLELPVFLERRSRPRNGRSVRSLNVAIAAFLLVTLAPLMLIIAIAVRLTSKGPIIYKQVRVGRDRRRYDVLAP